MLLNFSKYKLQLVCNKAVTGTGNSAIAIGWVSSSFRNYDAMSQVKNKARVLQITKHKNWFRIAVLKRTQLLQKVL